MVVRRHTQDQARIVSRLTHKNKPFRLTPISFMTVMPAALTSSSSACIAGDTYDVVTTCFFALIAAFTTAIWYV